MCSTGNHFKQLVSQSLEQFNELKYALSCGQNHWQALFKQRFLSVRIHVVLKLR